MHGVVPPRVLLLLDVSFNPKTLHAKKYNHTRYRGNEETLLYLEKTNLEVP